MSLNYGTLKTNVGNRVGDTSTTFATIIGTYINQRYKDTLRRTNWQGIEPDYAITATSASTVTSASTYTLPSDFGKELYVYDTNAAKNIERKSLEELEILYAKELANTGIVDHYSIYETKNTSASSAEASAARVKKIRFWRAPTTDVPVTIPYIMFPADLSADSDELVLDCETAVEYGATADAWAYKRQMAKAQYYELMYEKAIQNLMWDKTNQPNLDYQFNVQALDRNSGI